MSHRTEWVDYAKAIGIILVVYGHVARGLFKAGIEMPENLYRLADSIVYSFHMPLFFFLSGLFFYQSFSRKGGVELTLNKVDTIVYPYLLWSVLQGTVEVLLSNYTNGSIGFDEVFSLWEPRAQFWFLYALFFVFVTSCVIFHFVLVRYVAGVFVLSCMFYIFFAAYSEMKLVDFLANNLVYFVFGIVFERFNFGRMLSSMTAMIVTMFAFFLSQFIFHGYLSKSYTDKGIESLLLALIAIFFVVALSMAIAKKPIRFISYIGASSMAIFVMHILAGSGVRVILNKLLDVESLTIHLVVGCLAGVLLPLIALKVISFLQIPYLFSAPLSRWLKCSYDKILPRTN